MAVFIQLQFLSSRCNDRANFFNSLVLYFYLEHVQRIMFCRCILIFNPAVFCVGEGVILWLKIKNPATTTIPCAANSLNLVGQRAASCCVKAVGYFGFVQNLYDFFSASSYRWAKLTQSLKETVQPLTLKPLSATRWSARADATKAIVDSYGCIQNALRQG